MLSLRVKSSSLNFLPCTLKLLYIFSQNASASGGLALPLDPAGDSRPPDPLAPLQESLPPPNSGSLEPPLLMVQEQKHSIGI